jgi:hypothetical protein
MGSRRYFQHNFRPKYKSKISVENALKHQQFIESMVKDAAFYFVDDIKSSIIPHSLLHKIIQKLKINESLSLSEKNYLIRNNLISLFKFSNKDISFHQFQIEAEIEKKEKLEKFEAERLKKENEIHLARIAEQALQKRIENERALRKIAERERQKQLELDPYYIAERALREKENLERKQLQKEKALIQKKRKALLSQFGLEESSQYPDHLYDLLKSLSENKRPTDELRVWLNSNQNQDFYTDAIHKKYYTIEAKFYMQEYEKNNNPHSAINASACFRKAKLSKEAIDFLNKIQDIKNHSDKKIVSAYLTTFGGAYRDLRNFAQAKEYALEAHHLTPKNFRPCTLLGAIHMQLYESTQGAEWYELAERLGAKSDDINQDLIRTIRSLDKNKRTEIIKELLKRNPRRYAFLKKQL